MALEIERKFLCTLTHEEALDLACTVRNIKSIYLENTKESSVRVVKDTYNDGTVSCKWTEKKTIANLLARQEDEEYLPTVVFNAIDLCNYPTIEKQRFLISVGGHIWEIDFFDNYEFVIAELEFESVEEAEAFTNFPSWIGKEVTDDSSYLNCNLAKSPLVV